MTNGVPPSVLDAIAIVLARCNSWSAFRDCRVCVQPPGSEECYQQKADPAGELLNPPIVVCYMLSFIKPRQHCGSSWSHKIICSLQKIGTLSVEFAKKIRMVVSPSPHFRSAQCQRSKLQLVLSYQGCAVGIIVVMQLLKTQRAELQHHRTLVTCAWRML